MTVLVAEKLSPQGCEMIGQIADVEEKFGLSPEELLEEIKGKDGLVVRSATKVTRDVFAASNGRLKVVARAGVGIDNIDLAAATEYGCLVVNAPTANTVAAAEHGIALICAMARNVAAADASMKAGKWERSKYVGVGLTGKNLVVMGFGKVGSEVARRGLGLGMNVFVHDPYVTEEKVRSIGVKAVDMDTALELGDFFSLHMPLTPITKGMFNTKTFSKMKKGARIVNVARGGVVDVPSLIKALDEGQVAQAALDVFEQEPPAGDDPVVLHPNVVVTPHLGASTVEAQEGVALEIAEAVCRALTNQVAPTAVNAPMVHPDLLKELKPYVDLAAGLGQTAVQLVGEQGLDDVKIVYSSSRGDDLDTRLLRAMVIKGLLESTSTSKVNLVNADLLAKNRGYNVTEITVRSDGSSLLSSMSVSLKTKSSKFSGSLDSSGAIYIEGSVRNGQPAITKIGNFDVDVLMEGRLLLIRHADQPGQIANVAGTLAEENINVSFMTVGRTARGQDAVMVIGVDDMPSDDLVDKIPAIPGLKEVAFVSDKPEDL